MNKVDILSELEEKLGKGRILVNEPLSSHATFRIGGPANFYFTANSQDEIIKAVKLSDNLHLPYFILGGGSNVLISDNGFKGLVIKNNCRGIKILSYKGKMEKGKIGIGDVLVEADSGASFNQLVRFSLEENLEGLEEFLGLPGSVGGAVKVNAHWHDKRVRDFVIAQNNLNDNIILSVVFKLKKSNNKQSLWLKAKNVIEFRQKKHPTDSSAGCVFQNIQKSQAMTIGTPEYTTSAGFLIEACGLKGLKEGNVQISPLHANFIINLGGGKATDVIKLIDIITDKVQTRFGVKLKEEIIKVGDF
ncbi:MAG: FAD-binding protein [Candidatus Gottesmanbacteria bacterium]